MTTRLPMLGGPLGPAPPPPRSELLGGRRVAVVHLGCPKNLVDSEHMLAALADAGATLTADARDADVVVLNTCAFIENAKRESIDRVLEAEQWKAEGEGRRVVVAGCLAERYPDELRREVPGIDAVVGTGSVLEVASAAAGLATTEPRRKLPEWLPDARTQRILTTPTHTAYLKISEGCDHVCSFCIIPKLRGKQRSRPVADVVTEARALVEQGVKELNLVAQDSTAYGEDLGLKDGLAELVRALGRVDGLAWTRVHYAYPTRLTSGFLDALADTDNACKYLDMPLQHASRAVLRAMRRGGDGDSYLRLLERIRARIPGVAIRSTFIVGFPNETEKRFQELLGFVREARIDRLGAFTYSHEEETTAERLRDRNSRREKERRRAELMRLQAGISRRKLRRLVGTVQQVLVDAVDPARGVALGRLWSQAPEVDGQVIVDAPLAEPGELLEARIVKAGSHDLSAVEVV